ncbi:MAG: DUF1007 family protein [Hyphomicrobiaceae bacterium]
MRMRSDPAPRRRLHRGIGPAALGATAAAALLAAPADRALAHPHVWIVATERVLYDKGTVTGIRNAWTFDDAFAADALDGLDTNGDGKYEPTELTELLATNMEGLEEFDYFTFAELAGERLAFAKPVDAALTYEDGKLTLHFTLPFEKPILAEAPAFSFAIYDPSYFIAFSYAETAPITLSEAAPEGCTAAIRPEEDETTSLADMQPGQLSPDLSSDVQSSIQDLANSFADNPTDTAAAAADAVADPTTIGRTPAPAGEEANILKVFGADMGNVVTVSCPG